MSDLISKSALLASTDKEEIHKYEIALFPTIEPNKGKWEYTEEQITECVSISGYKCSVCYGISTYKSRFCPNCGARMDIKHSTETS